MTATLDQLSGYGNHFTEILKEMGLYSINEQCIYNISASLFF